MSDGKPWHWGHYETMNVCEFLNMVEYYKDKQDDKERQRLMKK